jgi:hypothetical protein
LLSSCVGAGGGVVGRGQLDRRPEGAKEADVSGGLGWVGGYAHCCGGGVVIGSGRCQRQHTSAVALFNFLFFPFSFLLVFSSYDFE